MYHLECALKLGHSIFSIVSEKSLSGDNFEFNSFSHYQWIGRYLESSLDLGFFRAYEGCKTFNVFTNFIASKLAKT